MTDAHLSLRTTVLKFLFFVGLPNILIQFEQTDLTMDFQGIQLSHKVRAHIKFFVLKCLK